MNPIDFLSTIGIDQTLTGVLAKNAITLYLLYRVGMALAKLTPTKKDDQFISDIGAAVADAEVGKKGDAE